MAPGLLQYNAMVNPVVYFQEVIQELKKVTWPSATQTRDMTILVIIVTLLMGLYIGGLDLLFQRIMAFILTQ